MESFYLIDGNAYIHRAYHALPPLTTSRGEQINAVYGFLRMLLKLIKVNKPNYLAICFDFPGKTFRHIKFSEYKATRKELDDALRNQIPIAKEFVRLFDIKSFEKEGYEADDLIATIVKKVKKIVSKVVIVTGDKDALQLVAENITVFNEHKNIIYDIEKVKEKYNVYPSQLVDVFALAGDSTDNIPGVKGIGDKTAIKIIQEFSSLDNLLNNLDKLTGKLQEKLKNQSRIALLSRELVKLNENAEIQFELESCKLKKIDYRKIVPMMKKYEFDSLLNEIATQDEIVISENRYSDISGKYKPVMSEVILKELLEIIKSSYMLSIDLETTGLDPFKCNIVGIALSTKSHTGYYIPLNHNYLGCPKQLQERDVLELLKPILEDEKIKKYGQNIKYVLEVLNRYGINLCGIYFDTSIASYCLNPTKKSHNLKDIAAEFLSVRMTP
ncbi:MAG: 5'-3' exonuclease H3TH domain-containing protein, partial [Elusimicrobiota bacterium]|nr:5'-3' exonuclease H3TH domain-containing protein [Elusimicrobiota bacterium]